MHWDGTNTAEFTDNMTDVTAIAQSPNVLLIWGSQAVTVPADGWVIVPSDNPYLGFADVLTPEEYAAGYTAVTAP
jgi:hypothetical protein